MKKISFAILVLILFNNNPTEAATVGQTKEQLCTSADIVLIGKVTDIDTGWEETSQGYIITANVTFDVERMIHGSYVSTIDVYTLGGKIDDLRLTVGSTPPFSEDERYLLFLHSRVSDLPTISAQGAGAIRLDHEATLESTYDLVTAYGEICQ